MPKADTALDPAALLDKAQRQTGLSDFGGKTFHEPFEILLQSLRDEANLNARGVFMMHRTMLRLLSNRLRTEQAFAEKPALAETPIPRPLFVIGFPRTGTTLLHNLLACDPAARWMRLWEGLYPAPAPQSLEDDPRISEVEEWAAGFEKVAPRLAAAHKLAPRGPEECLWLIEHTFNDLIFELRAHVPTYSRWLASTRRMSTFINITAANSNCLAPIAVAIIGCSRRRGIYPVWLVCSPSFPRRASCKPIVIPPPCCPRSAVCVRSCAERPVMPWTNPPSAPLARALEGHFEKATAVRATAAEGQILDIQYADLVADPIATVQHIYAHHGYEFTEPFEAAMRQWLAANRQHKHGAHRYTLEEYGLSEAQVREDFSDYAKEFGL